MSEHAISEEQTAALVPVSAPGAGKDVLKLIFVKIDATL